MKLTLNTDISRGAKRVRTVDSLFEGVIDNTNQLLIEHSFYLPVDLLKNVRYCIHQPVVLEMNEFHENLAEGIYSNISFEGNRALILKSRLVGVSVRRDNHTNKTYTVVKVWYGEKA